MKNEIMIECPDCGDEFFSSSSDFKYEKVSIKKYKMCRECYTQEGGAIFESKYLYTGEYEE